MIGANIHNISQGESVIIFMGGNDCHFLEVQEGETTGTSRIAAAEKKIRTVIVRPPPKQVEDWYWFLMCAMLEEITKEEGNESTSPFLRGERVGYLLSRLG